MNYTIESVFIHCPYCGERIELLIDQSIAEQEYVEDCSVCCRPIGLSVQVAAAGIAVSARTDSD